MGVNTEFIKKTKEKEEKNYDYIHVLVSEIHQRENG